MRKPKGKMIPLPNGQIIFLTPSNMKQKECRSFAKWLNAVADWLDHQESVKKKRGS